MSKTSARAIPARRKYRVLYAVTRSEYYEIEAESADQARDLAFSDGKLLDLGETTDVTDCEVEDIGPVTRRRPTSAET
jgi:hypothetical protein